jgi:hypothetical protein
MEEALLRIHLKISGAIAEETRTVDVAPSITVEELKCLAVVDPAPGTSVRMVYQGHLLLETATLSSSLVTSGAFVHVFVAHGSPQRKEPTPAAREEAWLSSTAFVASIGLLFAVGTVYREHPEYFDRFALASFFGLVALWIGLAVGSAAEWVNGGDPLDPVAPARPIAFGGR